MKSRFMRIILSVLILSLALQTIPLPALARSEANQHQTEIEVPTILSENRLSSLPDDGDDQPYPIDDDFDCTTVTDVLPIECEALVDLYQSTNGDNWRFKGNWLQDTKVAEWYGVTVDSGVVTQLQLYSNYMNGSIPTKLGNLSNLRVLRLNGNQLSGSIPSTLGNLPNLQTFSLSHNILNGSIPAELGSLSNLLELHLNSNKLNGNIPSTLGNLSKLEVLSLGDNQLTGSIPTELGNLSGLWALHLNSNKLTGSIPLSFVNLAELVYFNYFETNLCEPATKEFLDWKETVSDWNGTGVICGEQKLICLPLIFR